MGSINDGDRIQRIFKAPSTPQDVSLTEHINSFQLVRETTTPMLEYSKVGNYVFE